jgi:hypothetical protein
MDDRMDDDESMARIADARRRYRESQGDDAWHVGDSPKAKPSEADMAGARDTFRQWSGDEDDVKAKVNDIFNDRRGDS